MAREDLSRRSGRKQTSARWAPRTSALKMEFATEPGVLSKDGQMIHLTEVEISSLKNMAQKRNGAVTQFLNIASAQRLTELGLAVRTRQGWDITDAGMARLAEPMGRGPTAVGG